MGNINKKTLNEETLRHLTQKIADVIPSTTSGLVNDSDFATNASVDEKISKIQIEGGGNTDHVHGNKDVLDTIARDTVNKANNASQEGHTHVSTEINDLQGKLDTKVDKMEGKQLSENDFTTILKTKLDEIEENANNYKHPAKHVATMITQDATHRFVTDEEKNTWNGKSNFDGNYNNLSNRPSIPTKISELTNDSNFLTQHQDISGKVDKVEGKGLSENDFTTILKNKLDSIAENANNYTHPSNHSASIITQNATHRFVTDEEKNTWNSAINFNNLEVYSGNVDSKTESGYYLTNGNNGGLPPECNDFYNRTGLLYVISANKGDGKCIQTYYPLDGATNGNVYWRAVFPGDIKPWKKVTDDKHTHKAKEIKIENTSSLFTSSNVEDALAEIKREFDASKATLKSSIEKLKEVF